MYIYTYIDIDSIYMTSRRLEKPGSLLPCSKPLRIQIQAVRTQISDLPEQKTELCGVFYKVLAEPENSLTCKMDESTYVLCHSYEPHCCYLVLAPLLPAAIDA